MGQSSFFAMLFRMKYINRWGLMRNTRWENLSEHSLETAMLAHILAVIGNRRLNRQYPLEHIVLHALYHDCSEILTGDLPTPSNMITRRCTAPTRMWSAPPVIALRPSCPATCGMMSRPTCPAIDWMRIPAGWSKRRTG